MSSLPREKIALVVFTACILLIVAGIIAYMVAGHSWNYAASRIDDAAGEMEGYRIVLYEGTAIPDGARIDSNGALRTKPASIESTKRDYIDKGADVFVIDSSNLAAYHHPAIFERDGYRVGVFTAENEDSKIVMQQKSDFLANHQCDVVIAITPSADLVSKIEGIDVILDLEQTGPLSANSVNSHRYRVKMPETGAIEAIVISPSEVVSARTISHR